MGRATACSRCPGTTLGLVYVTYSHVITARNKIIGKTNDRIAAP